MKRSLAHCRPLGVLVLLIALATGAAATAQEPAGGGSRAADVTSPTELAVQKRLMAPCCWAGTIDNHDSQVANEMKGEIRTRLGRGESPETILAHFTSVYGQRVLAEPPARGLDALVYVLPILALVLGGGLIVAYLRRQTRARPAAAAHPAGSPLAPDDDPYERRVEAALRRLER